MKLFYDESGGVWGFESDGSQDHLIGSGFTQMSESEISEHKNPTPTTQELIDKANAEEFEALAALDLASIRDIRKWIADQSSAPQALKDRETQAVAARGRIK